MLPNAHGQNSELKTCGLVVSKHGHHSSRTRLTFTDISIMWRQCAYPLQLSMLLLSMLLTLSLTQWAANGSVRKLQERITTPWLSGPETKHWAPMSILTSSPEMTLSMVVARTDFVTLVTYIGSLQDKIAIDLIQRWLRASWPEIDLDLPQFRSCCPGSVLIRHPAAMFPILLRLHLALCKATCIEARHRHSQWSFTSRSHSGRLMLSIKISTSSCTIFARVAPYSGPGSRLWQQSLHTVGLTSSNSRPPALLPVDSFTVGQRGWAGQPWASNPKPLTSIGWPA